jgi:phosphatidylserine/phosphatidylglycerophosphate/cardiolipin synthase-like enzyme
MPPRRKAKEPLPPIEAGAPEIIPGAVELLTGEDLHRRVMLDTVLNASRYVWLATANLKDMHIAMARGRYISALHFFEDMAKKGVSFRVIHGDRPSGPFMESLSGYPALTGGAMEFQHCPRSHWKVAVIDGKSAYLGSANFTGAGLGCRSERRRNLEIGILTADAQMVRRVSAMFDAFWMGGSCAGCFYKKRCPAPIEPG